MDFWKTFQGPNYKNFLNKLQKTTTTWLYKNTTPDLDQIITKV